jgi:putative CocE/NonD family hydrolase
MAWRAAGAYAWSRISLPRRRSRHVLHGAQGRHGGHARRGRRVPDGRAIFLTDGILRARYRNSLAEPEPLTPGQPYELHLDLSITSNVFLPGHRMRLEVSSSNFPRFDRNSNTGGLIADESASEVTVAVNRVLHGPDYPSRLILPVIRR